MVDYSFSQINNLMGEINTAHINTNSSKNFKTIYDGIEKFRRKINEQTDKVIEEINQMETEVISNEDRSVIGEKVVKLINDMKELIERINRYNGLVDREERKKKENNDEEENNELSINWTNEGIPDKLLNNNERWTNEGIPDKLLNNNERWTKRRARELENQTKNITKEVSVKDRRKSFEILMEKSEQKEKSKQIGKLKSERLNELQQKLTGEASQQQPPPTTQTPTPTPTTNNEEKQEKVNDINTLINGLNPFLEIYNELRKLEEFVQIEKGIEGGASDWWKTNKKINADKTQTADNRKMMDSILKFMVDNEDCNNFEKLSTSDCQINNEISTPGVKSLISQLKQDNHNLKKIKNGIINTKDSEKLVQLLELEKTTLTTYYFKRLVYDIINPEGNATFESNKEKLLYNLGATFDEKIEIRKKGIFDYLKKNYKIMDGSNDNFEARFNEETIKNQIMKGYKIPENSDCSKITEKNTISLLTCLIITIDRNWDGKISAAEMKAANLDNIMKGLGENGPVSQEKFIDFFLENTTGVNAPKNGLRLRSNKSLTEEQAAKLEEKPAQTNIIPSGIVPNLVQKFNPLTQKKTATAEEAEKAKAEAERLAAEEAATAEEERLAAEEERLAAEEAATAEEERLAAEEAATAEEEEAAE